MVKFKTVLKNDWRVVVNIVTVIALGISIYVLRQQIVDAIVNLENINLFVILLLIPAQMCNYYGLTSMHQAFYDILGTKVSFKQMLKVMLELNFVNNIFPSGGVTGISYFGLRMRKYGASGGQSTLVQLMKFGFLFISFQVLLVFGLLFLAIGGKANSLLLLIAGSIATLMVIGTLAVVFIIGSETRIDSFFTYITRVINRLIQIVRPKHPETINISKVRRVFGELHKNYLVIKKDWSKLRKPFIAALLANIGEVGTIYVVYIAFGEWVNVGAIIIAYAVANFAGFVSVLPGGVGIYEALMTSVLVAAGVPAGLSIAVTVTYRVLNMLIQLPPGFYFYHKPIKGDGSDG